MKRYITTTLMLAIQLTKRFARDKVGLFFTFLFPLIFLLVFGTLNRGSDDLSFDIALINHSDTSLASDFSSEVAGHEAVSVWENLTTLDEARESLGRGEIDSILELPSGFGAINESAGLPQGTATVYYDASAPQGGQTFASVISGMLDSVNASLVSQEQPFGVEQRAAQTESLKPFDYVFSGLIGFSILSLALFVLANGLPSDKKVGYLRRLRATPLRVSQFLFATGINYLVLGLLSIALMFAVGIWIFDFEMRGDYINFTVFATLGIITMLGFGLAIGGWAKNEIQAAPLTNILAFPLMFLSGTFFPRFLMPDWLQPITNYLPLTPIVDGLRSIMTEGQTLLQLGPQLALMGVWVLVIYVLAFRVFRWE